MRRHACSQQSASVVNGRGGRKGSKVRLSAPAVKMSIAERPGGDCVVFKRGPN